MQGSPEVALGVVEHRGRQTRRNVAALIGRSAGSLVHVERLKPEIAELSTPTERAEVVLDFIDATKATKTPNDFPEMPTDFMLDLADYCATNMILSNRRRDMKTNTNEAIRDRSGRKIIDRALIVRNSLRNDLLDFIELHSDSLSEAFEARWFLVDLETRLVRILEVIEPNDYAGDDELGYVDTSLIRGLLAECMAVYHARRQGLVGAQFSEPEDDKCGIDFWVGYDMRELSPIQVKSRLKANPAERSLGVSTKVYTSGKCPQVTLVDWDPYEHFFFPEKIVGPMTDFMKRQLNQEL